MTKKFTGNSKGEVVEKLLEVLEVKQATLYKRMEFLGISIQKHSNESWIDEEDYQELAALGEWIDTHGKMEGFEKRADQQAIVKTEETTLDIPAEQPTVQAENNSRNFGSEQQQMSQLVASAQNKAAGVLMAEGILAQQFIANPEMLPEQLKQQIQEANAIPQVDPNAFAAELLRQHRTVAA
ncbi:MAG: hypothetical protein AAFO04_19390 [Cyanobacteria bacterium J06592_8]